MGVYKNLTEAEKKYIENMYSISIKKVENIRSGILNSNFYITSIDKKFVLRVFEENRSIDEDIQELNLLESLENIIPIAMPIKNKNKNYISIFNEKKFTLFEFISGEAIKNINSFNIKEIGEYLGKFHKFTNSSQEKDYNRKSRINFSLYYEKIKVENIIFEFKDIIMNKAKTIENIDFSSLPSGIIHADIFPDNVLVKDDKIQAIIDFNESCYAPFVYDIAIVINFWIKIFKFDSLKEENLIREFLNSYSKFRKITSLELRFLKSACDKAALTFIFLRLYKEYVEDYYNKSLDIEKKSYLDLISLIL